MNMQPVKARQKGSQDKDKTNSRALIITAIIILSFSMFLFILLGRMLLPEKKIIFDQANRTFVVKGDVKIKKAKTPSWQVMDASTILEKGDIVETAEESSVDIIIGSNTEKSIKVEEKSSVEFDGINPTALNFSKGKVLIAIKKLEPKSSFIVKTPTAACGARGTAWSEEADSERTKVCVFENQIYAQEVNDKGKIRFRKHSVDELTERVLLKYKPISEPQKISERDIQDWEDWKNSVVSLREGKILVNDFNRKENYNNLNGPFGSWNIFYSDPNQHCKDEVTALGRAGDKGYGLKLDYDVDSPYSAYNGFFTNLMGIDISEYKCLIFSVKGDKDTGFTTKINIELKNKRQTGKITIDGITEEWKRIAIPLYKFSGISNFKDMEELVIVFSDLNVTRKTGVIYIDDIYFIKTEPSS